MGELPFNIHVVEGMPEDQILIGDFTEFERARDEKRPVNLDCFVLIKNVDADPKSSTDE